MIRIMWMVPICTLQTQHPPSAAAFVVLTCDHCNADAVESWLSLRFKDVALYIETARECYEVKRKAWHRAPMTSAVTIAAVLLLCAGICDLLVCVLDDLLLRSWQRASLCRRAS